MAAFNSMPHMPTGGPADGMHHHHHHHHGMSHQPGQPDLTLHTFDPDMTFDDALLDGGALPHLPFTPSYDFDNFATTFEDPFSYSTRAFEAPPNQDAINDEASPQELDNKLLGFSETIVSATVVDEMGKIGDMNITAELYGMFFVAEDVFGADTTGRPLELTCYRRNLWQCSGQITLPRIISHVIDDKGRQIPLMDLSATISGIESIEGKATEIISIPWKNSNNPQATEEPKVAGPPPSISLDLSAGQEHDASRISLPVSWKRLQFKHATANNGRRKGLQQHYVVQISLVGNTKAGEMVKIAEIRSGPVIVRGRSPRNFDSRKDVPLSGDKRTERRNTATSADANVKAERDNFQASVQKRERSSISGNEWATPQAFPQPSQSPHPAKRMALSPTTTKPPVPGWSKDNVPAQQTRNGPHTGKSAVPRTANASAPINLSLSEDERSPNRSSAEISSPQLGKVNTATGQVAGSSPPEEEDLLYEYFPLSVDDWMPPVDAVYRPHVVHHTIVPPEIKAQQVQSKTKRYFAAE